MKWIKDEDQTKVKDWIDSTGGSWTLFGVFAVLVVVSVIALITG